MSPALESEVLHCSECARPFAQDDLARFGIALVCWDCKSGYLQKLREGVVGTAHVPYAGFGIRAVAWLIDGIIMTVAGSIVQFVLIGSWASVRQPLPGASPEVVLGAMAGMVGLVFLVDLMIGCAYEALFLRSSLMATPGKLALDLKVVRPNGARLTFARAAGRFFAKRLNFLTVCIGYAMAAFDSEKRGLHDMICDTRVIKRDR